MGQSKLRQSDPQEPPPTGCQMPRLSTKSLETAKRAAGKNIFLVTEMASLSESHQGLDY
jgi:hypothetical protein